MGFDETWVKLKFGVAVWIYFGKEFRNLMFQELL